MSAFSDILGALNNTFRVGLKGGGNRSFTFFNGSSFTINANPSANNAVTFLNETGNVLTDANRTITPTTTDPSNTSNYVAWILWLIGSVRYLIPAFNTTFTSAVPFDRVINVFSSSTISSNFTFTIGSGTKYPGAKTIYRIVGNGVNTPNFSAFKETTDSSGYDFRNNIVNIFEFFIIDSSSDVWVRIYQQKYALPSMISVALSFPNRSALVTNPSTNVYGSSGSAAFDAFMGSAQAIPAGKAGEVIFRCDNASIVGFNDVNTAQAQTNYEYYIWLGPTTIYTGTGSGNLDSGLAATEKVFLRLVRDSSGVVTAWFSQTNGNWTLARTFGTTYTGVLYVCCTLTGLYVTTKQMEFISFNVEA
jgi:hypothetical protein